MLDSSIRIGCAPHEIDFGLLRYIDLEIQSIVHPRAVRELQQVGAEIFEENPSISGLQGNQIGSSESFRLDLVVVRAIQIVVA